MKKAAFFIFLTLFSSALLGQGQDKRLTFILTIDDELPVTDITDGVFLLKDSTGTIKDKISFDYHVGGLGISAVDYKTLFASNPEYSIFIKFKHTVFRPNYTEYIYEKEIPRKWLNEEYIILKIYNASNKVSRAKYFFKHGQKYLIRIKIPGSSTILITRKK
jgi:hypothetical protein